VLRNEGTWRSSCVAQLADAGYRCVNVGKMHSSPWETPLGFHERVVVENKDRDHPMVAFLHDELDKALFIRGERRQVRSPYRRRPDHRERRGVLQDTVIVFCSDHGDTLGDHGHVQKWTMYEGSVHVPALVWRPGRVRAQRVKQLVSLFDLGPTVLELAGCQVPSWMQARTLLPVCVGEPWSGREVVFSEHARDAILTATELMTMAFDGRFKLVEFLDADDGQLSDLRADPGEEHSLFDSADPEPRAARVRLHDAIAQWRTRSLFQTRDRQLPLR
jgi:arylsulfatase A-like enzyme